MIRTRLWVLVATIALVVATCGNTDPTPVQPRPTVPPSVPPSVTPSSQPPAEQTLAMAIDGDLSGGLSNAATGPYTPRVAAFLYDGLYGYDANLAPVPKLAEGLATVSADGLTWTVELRTGITFHDSSPLTADDVVQTYGLARSPNCRLRRPLCLAPVLASVQRVDDRTITFTLTSKLASFAATLAAIGIESEAAIDASYARFLEKARAVGVTEIRAFLEDVAIEESSPTGPAGPVGTATVDYGRFRAPGEALLRRAGIPLPSETTYTTDGVFDVGLYTRDMADRIRAIDASFTDRPIDAMAAAYPYLDYQADPVGSGPFKFAAYVPGDRLELVANEAYFLGEPNIKRLVFPMIGSDAERAKALADGTIDWDYAIQGPTYDQIKTNPDLKFVEYLDLSFLGLYFNLHPESDGLFLDRNLRQAVSYCFDKPAVAATATDGHGVAIYSEIPPGSWAYPTDGLNTYPLDRAKATGLIEASGWTLGTDGIYEKAGRTLRTIVAVRTGEPQRSTWLKLMSDQVRECGIDITYKEVPFTQIQAMLDVYPHVNAAAPGTGRPFDAYFGGFRVGLDPDPSELYRSSECSSIQRPTTLNYICYADPAVDTLIDAGLHEFDQARRAAIYQQYAILQSEDLPVIYAWSDKVREGLRTTVDTTASGGLRYDTPMWFRDVEHLTNVK